MKVKRPSSLLLLTDSHFNLYKYRKLPTGPDFATDEIRVQIRMNKGNHNSWGLFKSTRKKSGGSTTVSVPERDYK